MKTANSPLAWPLSSTSADLVLPPSPSVTAPLHSQPVVPASLGARPLLINHHHPRPRPFYQLALPRSFSGGPPFSSGFLAAPTTHTLLCSNHSPFRAPHPRLSRSYTYAPHTRGSCCIFYSATISLLSVVESFHGGRRIAIPSVHAARDAQGNRIFLPSFNSSFFLSFLLRPPSRPFRRSFYHRRTRRGIACEKGASVAGE